MICTCHKKIKVSLAQKNLSLIAFPFYRMRRHQAKGRCAAQWVWKQGLWEYPWKSLLNKGEKGKEKKKSMHRLLRSYKQTLPLCSPYVMTRESIFIHEWKCLWHLWSSNFPLQSSVIISLEISDNFSHIPDIMFSSFCVISLHLLYCFFQSINHLKNEKALPSTLQWEYEYCVITPESTQTDMQVPCCSV